MRFKATALSNATLTPSFHQQLQHGTKLPWDIVNLDDENIF